MSETDPLAPLNKMRRIATGLLVLMAVVFVLARKYELLHPALGFVRAFAEAALVGALADWFAVSALFRHPLGLPIPHTAIIQKNKDRIGVSIAAFLENNFMTQAVVSAEFGRIDFAGAASRWLAVPANSEAVAQQLSEGLPTVLRLVEDDDIRRFIHGRIDRLVEHVRFAPLLADMLTILVADRRHQELFDHLLVMVAGALEKNQDFIRQKIHDNSPRWMPRVFDDQFFERLLNGLQQVLEEMKQPESQWRERFQESVEDLVAQLRVSDDYEVRMAALVQSGLQHPVFRNYVDQIWHDLRQRLLDDVTATDSRITAGLAQALQAVSAALASDNAVRVKLNDWLRTFAADAVVKRRGTIASLVERVIRQWDGETVSRKFEQYVGRDLQFIRINGTVVGGLVGLILHSVALML
ncbi:DUF445 domain-containing protein [Actimicrobium sp. CCI2.3]|uniref:DUF445 domain-containing protein n=1 Tax=Actimicrobium sp. CCI2.3 TaxID=3048616 RepID=UPI002AB49895|nr:DUF445 domain-containing protein [Actimicrobium sp. CCI2.3]MDY7575305.1 DUF445 domain-containing protein [Actimicrobium sp. CCI2.3]MEB0023105.1 DUF445 domain-containing protein [Actimicrobium sp. CCI2.3]